MKKRKNMALEKPVFWKMFVKRFVIIALIAIIIALTCTKIASHFYGMYMARETMSIGVSFANEVFHLNEACVEKEQFMNGVSLVANEYSNGNRMYIMVDNVTGEVVKPSGDTLFLDVYELEKVFDYPMTCTYTCEDENIVKILKENGTEAGYYKGKTYICVDDFYIKEYTFVPGKTKIMTLRDGEDIVLKELDFTPEDVSGYTHVGDGTDVSCMYGNPIYFDPCLTQELVGCMEDTVANLDQMNLSTMSADEFNDVGSVGYNTCYSDAAIQIDGEREDEDYVLLGICHYNFIEKWKWECMISYIALTIVTLALAFVTTNVAYMNQKNYYEMDQYRRDITNTMAHDLKSPLMVISGYAENLLEQNLPEKAGHFSKSIIENTTYMNQIIEKTLELSKVESGSYKLQKESVNLREISEELINDYLPQMEERGLEVQVKGDKTLTADKISMRQVLDNIIGNAVKYSVEGSVIEIQMDNHSYVMKNVSAIDFDVDVQELAKPFVKGDDSRSGKKGSGIGLTIVKNLCEQQGYELSLACDDGVFEATIKF